MTRLPHRLLPLLLLVAASATAEEADWRSTLGRIASGVVSIRVDGTRAFDTNWNQSTQATGFVVDAERGLILTNRHVVTPGPVVAEAIFINNEEVELRAVYRDPVHDFGFYRYDPSSLRFIEPAELALAAEGAQVGREIRVVGNDAGEKLSILAGTLARLDRRAPDYGRGKYGDFNTFYYQAASSTSGGSSGSPVIDIEGRVVALNAGANTQAASSFFLPLDRVERALDFVREGEPVPRGTLMTEFVYTPFDELHRLGLDPGTEGEVRAAFPDATGMLVVEQVVPGSPVAGQIEPGDILVKIGGQPVPGFVTLEQILDDHVGKTVGLDLRRGGESLQLEVQPMDLHAITPDAFVQFGDAVVNQLSYQQARHLNMPPEGIYIANPGYVFARAGIPRAAVITAIDGKPTPRLEDFRRIVETLADGQRVAVRYFSFEEPRNSTLRVLRMDRRWFPAEFCRRDDEAGFWPCEPLPAAGQAPPPEPADTRFVAQPDPRLARLSQSLVMVNYDMPYPISGVSERHYQGTGVVIDAERGLVVVDRNTVPVSLGDARITIAGSLELPARVVWIHPLHNLAVVGYDPALIGDTPVRPVRFAETRVRPGDTVWAVGLKGDHSLAAQRTEVASIDPVAFPLSRTLRFRDTNLETISLVNGPSEFDGVLIDESGDVISLWSSFAYHAGKELNQVNKGLPSAIVTEVAGIVAGERPLRSLEAEFATIPLASARNFGLPESWARRLEGNNGDQREVLQIIRLVAGSPAAAALKTGDLLLAVDGEPVSSFHEVELLTRKPSVELILWRDGAELSLSVETVALDGHDIDRLVVWAGALLQSPHRAIAAQRGVEPYGVYVAYFNYGSPASRYRLWAGQRIVEVDGRPTPDLDAFLAAVAGRPDRAAVRLKTIDWNRSVEIITLKLDNRYWPAYELRRQADGWHRQAIDSPLMPSL
jgi:S1-C subfamily serine protease